MKQRSFESYSVYFKKNLLFCYIRTFFYGCIVTLVVLRTIGFKAVVYLIFLEEFGTKKVIQVEFSQIE
jgi:hypothetical protein